MANRFWVGGTGTWDASDTTHWAATSGGAGGQSVPTSADAVTFDASSGGGTVTVNHASNSVAFLTIGAFGGAIDFSVNNNDITIGFFSGTGTGVRTLNMGNGTWTITGANGGVWNFLTTTNLTFNANSSLLKFVATPIANRNIDFGALTYNNVEFADAVANAREVNFLGACTIGGTLTLSSNTKVLRLAAAMTITGAWTWTLSANNPGVIHTTGGALTITMAATNVLVGVAIGNITKAGAGSLTVNDGYDLGNNTNVTINNPTGGGVTGPALMLG